MNNALVRKNSKSFGVIGIVILVLASFVLLHAHYAYASFGVSPPYINADKLVPGVRYESTIYLVQGKPEQDLRVKAIFDVPDKIKSWLTVDKGEEFVIPAGTQQFPIKVTIRVPKDADLGIFNGHLRVTTIPAPKEGAQVTIAVGARIDLNIVVGDNVVSGFVVRHMDILDIEQRERPKITAKIENIGNVPVAPSRASFELFDKFGDIRIGFAQTEKIQEIPAFETHTITIEFPVDVQLGIGEYWGHAKIYQGSSEAQSIRTVFNVVESTGLLASIYDLLNTQWQWGIVGLIIVIAGIAWRIVRKRKKYAINTDASSQAYDIDVNDGEAR